MIGIDQYSRAQRRAAKRVMARLTQLERMESRRHRAKRQFERNSFFSTAILRIPRGDGSVDESTAGPSCTVWTRDLSRSGVSFICPFEVEGSRVVLGFRLPDESIKWYQAEIVREREIPDEVFWDYGTVFAIEGAAEPVSPAADGAAEKA